MDLRTALLVPFWNVDRRRLRAPWRLALAAVVLVGAAVLVGLLATVAGLGDLLATPASSLVLGAGTVVAVAVAAVALDRRRLRDYGLGLDAAWARDCAFGLGLGVALISGVAAVEWAAGWLVVEGTLRAGPDAAFAPALAGTLALFLAVGVYEELLARGLLLTNLAEGLEPLGPAVAVGGATLGSAAVFGFAHASNPSATLVSSLSVSLAGVVLALGYLLTDELAIPIGLHVSWNATLGVGYGLPVSGLRTPASLLATRVEGPTAVTGGSFGPEAGLLGVAALLVGAAATVAYVRVTRGRVRLHPGVWTPELRWRGTDASVDAGGASGAPAPAPASPGADADGDGGGGRGGSASGRDDPEPAPDAGAPREDEREDGDEDEDEGEDEGGDGERQVLADDDRR
jgi:hypothetical protein